MSNNFEPWQCRAARAALNWSAAKLETESGVSRKTITDFEGGKRKMQLANIDSIIAAITRAGVRFTDKGCVCLPGGKPSTGENTAAETIPFDELNAENDE
jgi:transcriptional regulator with XRE-family HTH domain